MKKILLMLTIAQICFFKAQAQDVSQYEAIFITKFVDYIEWPGGKSSLTIGVVGDSKVYDIIADILNKKGKNYATKKITSHGEIPGCDIIFVPENETKNFAGILAAAKGQNILIVSENSDLVTKGAGISFYMEDAKLKFAINKAAIEAENLKIAGSLLALGKAI